MHWTIVTRDTDTESFQRLEIEPPTDKHRYQRYAIRAVAGVFWFLNTFDIPLRIWGT